MNTYQFMGIISPPNLIQFQNLTIDLDSITSIGESIEGNIKMEITSDSLRVTMQSEKNMDSDLGTLKNSLESICRGFINSINFHLGSAIDITLTIGGNTSSMPFQFPPRLRFLNTTDRPINPMDIGKLTLQNLALRRSIDSAIEAIRNPMDTGFYCFRSLEAIRHHFRNQNVEDNDTSRTASWIEMRNTLKFDRTYIDLIQNHARSTRHGETINVSGDDIEIMITRTWIIIDRFIIYLNSNQNNLGNEFEILR